MQTLLNFDWEQTRSPAGAIIWVPTDESLHQSVPDAHVEAPTGGSVILAAIMLKMGGYGFVRLSLPIVPDGSAYFSGLMIALSLIAVVYIGFVALMQKDMKKLIALIVSGVLKGVAHLMGGDGIGRVFKTQFRFIHARVSGLEQRLILGNRQQARHQPRPDRGQVFIGDGRQFVRVGDTGLL